MVTKTISCSADGHHGTHMKNHELCQRDGVRAGVDQNAHQTELRPTPQ